MKIVIFDLDGTLALCDHRKHFIERPVSRDPYKCESYDRYENDCLAPRCLCGEWRSNWDAFFDACDKDEVNKPVKDLFLALQNSGYEIIVFSGRSNQVKDKTWQWLTDNGLHPTFLMMRQEGDFRPDEILKKEMLDSFLTSHGFAKEDISFVVDDRDKVVKMWRSEGLTCLQVAEGNF